MDLKNINNLCLPAESREEVEKRAENAVDTALLAMNIHPMITAVVRRLVLSAYPPFCGQMHQERAAGQPANVVRAAIDILFTNMLYECVSSLAPPQRRESILRDIVKKARASVLTALANAPRTGNSPEPEATETFDPSDLHDILREHFGNLNAAAITEACATIASYYLAQLPENQKWVKVEEHFSKIRREVSEA